MTEPASKTSPFVIAASIAVILLSLVGIAALTGLIPGHNAKNEAPQTAAAPEGAPGAKPEAGASAERGAPAPERAQAIERARTAERSPAPVGYPPPPMTQAPPGVAQPQICADCGVITSIKLVEKQGEGSALGVVAGGIVGGILGHQVGGGSGKDLATIAGAVGGGYAGNEIEKKARSTQTHEITVRMDDGRSHTIAQQADPAFTVGDRVRVVNGVIRPY